jgi:Transposase DDE domain
MFQNRSAASGTGLAKRTNNVVCARTGQRVRGKRSKRLQKLRGELCERSFAHCYETGAMRRMYVRGEDKVFKRVLVQAAAFNIGLLLRTLSRWGKPRQSQGRLNPLQALLCALFAVYDACRAVWHWLGHFGSQLFPAISTTPDWRVRSP